METTPMLDWSYGPPPSTPVAPAPSTRRRRRTTAALTGAAVIAAAVGGAAWARASEGSGAVPGSVLRGITVDTAGVTGGTAQRAAAAIAPSVVTLSVRGPAGAGTGSGVVVRSDGFVLTNEHVVSGASSVEVELSDGRTLPATVVGTDPTSDLAVVHIEGADDLVAAVFADSDALQVGQQVLAVGAPLGLSSTVTSGIVSTLHRPVRTGDAAESAVLDAVQTDAAINPGNSGGALVDLSGSVVGIPSAIATTSSTSGSIGVGFAIPSNDAAEVADEIIATGAATHAQLGVSLGGAAPSGTGAVLSAVTAGGAAEAAGLRAGDVVVAVGDREVVDADDLVVAVRAHDPGQAVPVRYLRAGVQGQVTARLTTAS